MIHLLRASFGIITRQFPTQAYIKNVRVTDALYVYALTLLVTGIEMLFPLSFLDEHTFTSSTVPLLGGVVFQITSLLIAVAMSMWVLNWYAREKFTFKDVFVLEVLLTTGWGIVFSVFSIIASIIGGSLGAALGIGMFIFGIYMLLVFQAAISSIASITKSQAAYVILAPIVLIIGGYLLFLAIVGGFAAMQ